MKTTYTSSEIVSGALPLSARVQKALKLIEEGRFQKKPLFTEGLTVLDEETVKLPLVKRKALAIKKVLSEMPIEIREHELLVGCSVHGRSKIIFSTPFPEYATQDEKDAATEKFTGTGSVFGHFSPYYPRYLKLGLNGLRGMALEKLDMTRKNGKAPEKEVWYESVIICLDALAELIRRYRDLASKLADGETDPARKEKLQVIAGISQHLLQGPPQSFREALQALWFAHIAFMSTLNKLPVGRFDQNLWPYLKRDLENGVITIVEAQELIDCLWLKFNERLQAFEIIGTGLWYTDDSAPAAARAAGAGAFGIFLGGKTSQDRIVSDGGSTGQFLQTVTLSGLTPEGIDGTNPLTYLCLNAHRRLKTPQPGLYVRFHDASPPELYERVADCIRAGCIGPCVYNDEVFIPSLKKLGIPLEHARDYTSDGCFEVHVQGRTDFRHGWVSVAEVLDRILSPANWEEIEVPVYIEAMDPFRGSKPPDPYSFSSFDEVMEAVKELLDRGIKGFIEVADSFRDGRLYNIAPLPLLSAFVEGPLESGQDISQGGMEYIFHMVETAGVSHVADSLAVIKKLCFEEKVIEWPELLDAIRDNWQDREALRQFVRTRAPAYGNDVDYVDDIAKEIVDSYIESVKKHSAHVKSKTKFTTGIATFEQYTALGRIVGATPDGRLAGEPISTNASPSIGRATSGQTAAVNSYVKLPLADLSGGSILDINIETRAALLLQLEAFIKSFIEKRGNLISIAVNDCKKLRAAQKEPEKYRDLKVRVGGFDAYFVDLPPNHQQLQIERCEQYSR